MPTKTPLDHLEAEAGLDANSAVEVELEGKTLYVLPVKKWKASGLRALQENNIDLWAEKCLDRKSYAVWQRIDPDLEQCEVFFTNWQAATGENVPSS